MKKITVVCLTYSCLFICFLAKAQPTTALQGQDTLRRVITTAVPFLSISPDSRAAGMADVGAATSADANSVHWNAAKLPFIKNDVGFSFSYTPWLSNLINDMSISYLAAYRRISKNEVIGGSLKYFDLGDIDLRDANNVELGIANPREFAVDMTYSRRLTEQFGMAIAGRFIHSNLSANIASSGSSQSKAGVSAAVDVSAFGQKELLFDGKNANLAYGLSISNIGSKLTYSSNDRSDFIPGNLRLGTAFTTELDMYNKLTFAVDVNKLLVPTPPERDANGAVVPGRGKESDRNLLSGVFGSFSDAPDGMSEELKEFMLSVGAEYWYNDQFAGRVGYFHESEIKGNRKYISFGLGLRYQSLGLDIAYLVPRQRNNPLAETLRFTLLLNLNKREVTTTPAEGVTE